MLKSHLFIWVSAESAKEIQEIGSINREAVVFSPCIGNNHHKHPNWQTHIFRGRLNHQSVEWPFLVSFPIKNGDFPIKNCLICPNVLSKPRCGSKFRWPGPSLDPATIAGSSKCKSIESGIELGYLRMIFRRYSPFMYSVYLTDRTSFWTLFHGIPKISTWDFLPEASLWCVEPVSLGWLFHGMCPKRSVWKSGRSR